jgi:uncharacterized membrane-anchored protein YhcB (DUF1043 family)
MPYTAQFFAEKLNVPVEYFNPFRNVQISPSVNLEELQRVAHALGEVVGLGLRNLATCPVEMNLMPESTLRWQSFNQKKPYLIATVVSLVLVTFAVGYLFQKLADNKQAEIDRIQPQMQALNDKMEAFKQAYSRKETRAKEAEQIATWMQDRYYWGDFLSELRRGLIRSEDDLRKKLSASKPGADVGIWIEQLNVGSASASASAQAPTIQFRRSGYDRSPVAAPAVVSGVDASAATNAITLVCRAVSLLKTVGGTADNKDVAFVVRDQLAASPMVNPDVKATLLVGDISTDDANGTFTFTVNVTPAKPLTF